MFLFKVKTSSFYFSNLGIKLIKNTCKELDLDDGLGRIGLGCLWFKSLSSKLVVSLFVDDDNCLS